MSRSIRPASSTLAGSITANGAITSAPGATTAAQAATSPGADSASSTVGGRINGSNMRLILRDYQVACPPLNVVQNKENRELEASGEWGNGRGRRRVETAQSGQLAGSGSRAGTKGPS